MRFILPFVAALAAPVSAIAHPHVFVQAEVTLVFDEGGDLSVKLDWYYDDLFSLLVTSDLGLDIDGDLILTSAEQSTLNEQIGEWPPDYAGDLEVAQGDEVLTLAPKVDHRMDYVDGLFTETHARPVPEVADPDAPLRIRVYDPFFYVAYELRGPVTIEGRDDCAVEILNADLDAAYALAAELTDGQEPEDIDPDAYFPEIGDAFADTIIVTCADPL